MKIRTKANNPRVISKSEYDELVKSIKDFPEMLKARPIVVNPDGEIIGGTQRYRAAIDAGMKESEIPVYVADWNEVKQRKFVIKDNLHSGTWDWDMLANEWEPTELKEWGLSVWQPEDIDYSPTLEPESKYSDVTQQEIEEKAQELAEKMMKFEANNVEVMCPECGHEFQVQV